AGIGFAPNPSDGSSEQMTRHLRVGSGRRIICASVGAVAFAALFSFFSDTVKSQSGAAPCPPTGLRLASSPPPSPQPLTVRVMAPSPNATVSGTAVLLWACASDTGVVGVQFMLDGGNLGPEDVTAPWRFTWNTTATVNGSHTLTAVARDA